MRCLLLGASGYLGRHLRPALMSLGLEVHVPTQDSGQRLDLSNAKSLEGLSWDVDRVFMFAGTTGTYASFVRAEDYLRGNELALLNVLSAIRESRHRPRVIFPSSRLVYSGSERPLSEDSPQEARTVYAANKIACERLLQAYSIAHEVPYTIFRICVPYGNTCGADYSFGTIGNFINQALNFKCIRLYGDGTSRRTFTHIGDICQALISGGLSEGAENNIFNIPGEDLTLLKAARCIADVFSANIELTPWPEMDLRIESGSTVFDGLRLKALLGWEPSYSMNRWAATLSPTRNMPP
jgi:UDP-glucose 4-epimerase